MIMEVWTKDYGSVDKLFRKFGLMIREEWKND